MKTGMENLRISKEVDDVIQIEGVSTDAKDLYDLCLVGCFVTTSVVHFPGKEDPMLVSLVYFFFGVQVHDLPPRLFSKAVARQLENFAGLFKEYNTKQVSGGYTSYLQMRVRIDIRTPLKCRKKIQSSYGNSMDSFYHIRLTREVNKSDMEWDLSLWEVGRRATVVESV
ncbi:hypothetical protein Godav_010013 [Gossypium davidsonii]|uniref:Uncharacterized protein n=1 Tax=Gossypium davidsonii TaxID=34287 RepID=A0A7J8SFN0_GOSDV|nr:hypothetical protein [Gossypium davidsonii]